MAWKDTLFDVSFKDVPFQVLAVEDRFAWDLAEHELLGVNGASIEPLGEKAARFNLTAIIYGDNNEAQRDALLSALRTPGPGQLVHPLYGTIACYCNIGTVKTAAEPRDAYQIDLLFIEHQHHELFAQRAISADADQAEQAAQDTDQALDDEMTADPAFDPDPAQPFSLAALRNGIATLQNSVAAVKSTIDSTLSDIRFVASIGQLPGIWLGQMRGLYQNIAGTLHSILPDDDTANASNTNNANPGNIDRAARTISAWQAAATRVTSATTRSTPPQPLRAQVAEAITAATALSLLASEILAQEASAPTLSPPELATITNQCRALIQRALDQLEPPTPTLSSHPDHGPLTARISANSNLTQPAAQLLAADLLAINPAAINISAATLNTLATVLASRLTTRLATAARPPWPTAATRRLAQPLRNLAHSLQQAQLAALNQRPPLLTRPAPLSGNLALIAHALYADATRAPELARLNPQITNPNFIQRGAPVSAYAH